jgi:hypothetical protein
LITPCFTKKKTFWHVYCFYVDPILAYYWRSKKMKLIYKLAAISAALLANVAHANLITNGNFELGNQGFTSQLTYAPLSGVPESVYTVADVPSVWHPRFVDFADHTPGTGNTLMMMINGSTTAGTAGWRSSSIAVTAGTNYTFSGWAATLFSDSIAVEAFLRDGQGTEFQLGSAVITPITLGQWTAFSGATTWTASTTGSITLQIRSNSTQFGGNDYALDDLSFVADPTSPPGPPNQVPLPKSLWLLIAGGLGIVMLRKK